MKKIIKYLLLLLVGVTGYTQNCPQLINPTSGATNVPVETIISWEEIIGVPGYRIALGTTPGADDIIQDQSVGSDTSFRPPLGLPENTQIFVTITLFFFNGGNVICNSIPFTTEEVTTVPACTTLSRPLNNAIDVNIASNITWNYAPGATGYLISIGTTFGGTDIENNKPVGNILTYNPPIDFNTNTEIFVQITPTNKNGPSISCSIESFITGDVVVLPECSTLISSVVNGDTDVPLTPFLQWQEVAGAIGYKLFIGNSPFVNNILNGGLFTDTSTFVVEFEPNRTIYVTIVPFNEAGDAIGCIQESFSTAVGCGPFLNRETGELISLFPELDFPSSISTCANTFPITLSTDSDAEGFMWSQVTQNGSLIEELSTTREASISQEGFYSLEIFNFVDSDGNNILCSASQDFTVETIKGPTITSIDLENQGENLRFTVNTIGPGDYEFALNSIDGPYQDSNIFNNAPKGDNIVYVRDKNETNCILSEFVLKNSILDGFPNFFTPNGDGINDFWQFTLPTGIPITALDPISIFDRFGKLVIQINIGSQGWDGRLNGKVLPASSYWFRTRSADNNKIQGYFALKR